MGVSTFLMGSDDPEVYSMTDGIKRPDRNIQLDEVIGWTERDPLWAARGRAIQGYAQLESGLCTLMATVGGMSRETALTTFYKITNTNARNSILEKLLHTKCGQKFNRFWNGYVTDLRILDGKRNEIVHWLAAANVLLNADGVLLVGVTLIAPASVGRQAPSPRITTKELLAFEEKCEEFARLANNFAMRINPPDGASQELREPWLDIYQLPFVYPLPEGHPLKQKPAIQQSQPQPSRA